MEELKAVLERIAAALEARNEILANQEIRAQKLDKQQYENMKKPVVQKKKIIQTEPRMGNK
jgi:hypothetical protein